MNLSSSLRVPMNMKAYLTPAAVRTNSAVTEANVLYTFLKYHNH
jgi:hypothetical protein